MFQGVCVSEICSETAQLHRSLRAKWDGSVQDVKYTKSEDWQGRCENGGVATS